MTLGGRDPFGEIFGQLAEGRESGRIAEVRSSSSPTRGGGVERFELNREHLKELGEEVARAVREPDSSPLLSQ